MSRRSEERMLPHDWRLDHAGQTIPDTEGLCRGVLAEVCNGKRGHSEHGKPAFASLEPSDFDALLAFLLEQTVYLVSSENHRPFDPTKGGPLRAWLYAELRWDLIDYLRSASSGFGRDGRHRVASWVGGDIGDVAGGGHRLGEAAVGDPADRADARGWLQSEADRGDAGLAGVSGLDDRERAAGRDPRPGGGASERTAGGPAGASHFRDCGECGWRTYRQAPNGKPGWHFEDTACVACGAAFHQDSAAVNEEAAWSPDNHDLPAGRRPSTSGERIAA